jgi:hypothetical protein
MKEIKTLADVVADDLNCNEGTVRGMAQLEHSLTRLGAGRSVVVDRNGKLIAGNKTSETWGQMGLDGEVVVVRTDGTKLVVVQREDLDLDSEKDLRARELAVADNRVAETNLKYDPAALLALRDAGVKVDHYWVPEEMDRLREELRSRAEAEAAPLAPQTPLAAAPPPAEFKSFDPQKMDTEHACPKCGFRF